MLAGDAGDWESWVGMVVGHMWINLSFLEGREAADPRKVAIKAARGRRGSRKATPAWWPRHLLNDERNLTQ